MKKRYVTNEKEMNAKLRTKQARLWPFQNCAIFGENRIRFDQNIVLNTNGLESFQKKKKKKAPLFYAWLVTVPHAIRHRLEPFLFGISSVVFMWLRFCIIIFLSYFFIFSSLNLNVFLYIFFWQKEKQFINSKDGSTCPKGVARLVRGVSLGLFWYIRRAYRDSTPPPPSPSPNSNAWQVLGRVCRAGVYTAGSSPKGLVPKWFLV